ncbi:hypothetical protein EV360DRAFT_77478 [Lentinula raphanica]|nr:hypothetical protein EV360DRAFT_77478 [Lentinula raphanica]
MASRPTLHELNLLRAAPRLPDTATERTFDILYIHPDHPFPLLQPIRVPFIPGAVGAGFVFGLLAVLQGSPYIPVNSDMSLNAVLCVDNGTPVTEFMSVALRNGPPFFRGPLCTDVALCTRTVSTRFHLVHGFAYMIDGHGELRNAVNSDRWTLWNWLRTKSCNHRVTYAQDFNPF